MRIPFLLLACALIAGCAVSSFGPKADRNAFFHEILFPKETQLTRKFDAYTSHSYMVEKYDLAQALGKEAELSNKRLLGLYVIGPGYLDPLWTYYIMTFIEEDDFVRINILVYPHARITGKGTGVVSRNEYVKFRDAFSDLDFLKDGWPADAAKDSTEFSYNILGVTYSDGAMHVVHGQVADLNSEQAKSLEHLFNGMFEKHVSTYPSSKLTR